MSADSFSRDPSTHKPTTNESVDDGHVRGRAQHTVHPTSYLAESASPAKSITVSTSRSIHSALREDLIDFHTKQIKYDRAGSLRPPGVLRNNRSIVNKFFSYLDVRAPHVDTSAALGLRFAELLTDYLSHLGGQNKSKHTVNTHKSVLRSFRESWVAYIHTDGLPKEFGLAVLALFQARGCALADITEATGISEVAIRKVMCGQPTVKSIAYVESLEDFFEVARGTLSSKLPDALWLLKGRVTSCNTEWRAHQKLLVKSTYRLKEFPPQVQASWEDMFRFYVDLDWARAQGLLTNSEWRIRRSSGKCPTARIQQIKLESFFGYLLLSSDALDPWQRGQGFKKEDLSLSLMAVPRLVEEYLEFKRARTCKRLHTNYAMGFLIFCEQLLREETGFLRQQPHFGSQLVPPVEQHEWDGWCATRLREIKKLRKRIFPPKKQQERKNQGKVEGMTRDPFAVVKDYIESLDQPISILWDLARSMHALVPFQEKGSPGRLAALKRDICFVKMIASNPLRCQNYAMMGYQPKDWGKFRKACEIFTKMDKTDGIYLETEETSNLFQKRDGSWWLRFNPEDFKNQVGAASVPYEVPLVEDVVPVLFEYLFKYRPVLLQLSKQAISGFREKNNLPPLTAEEERKIDQCAYFLRPNERGFYGSPKELRRNHIGAEQMNPSSVSAIIYYRTRRHLPDCKGFSAHACRHLVASHYIKNDPDGWAVAAAALHDRVETVKKHYAWVRTADKIKPWNLHYTLLKRKYDAGQL